MSYSERQTVDTPGGRTTAVARRRRFSPGQVVTGLLGILLVVMGIVAVTRCGIDGSMNTPVTNIFGLAHSSWIGIAEIVAGLLMVVGSADAAYRGVAAGVGVILFLGGIFIAAGSLKILLNIGTERATGWFLLIVGALAIAGAMLPMFDRSERQVVSDDHSLP
jgi:membrane-bound ClpP family serine protease